MVNKYFKYDQKAKAQPAQDYAHAIDAPFYRLIGGYTEI